ncbi:MAG: hypothetical protein CMN65_08780 [Sphingomonadaceae bacterium]|nr:hypothetical protein [Sphingomonadaceae bacterium]|tara:strand:+ start:78 stop:497 length:420 start_codon:yes stop_codon:yes gene_type:complete
MLRSVLPAFFLSLAFPTAASAQATDREGLSDLGEQMRDPAYQRDMALMLQAMTEVLLDMPVAPLAQAAAEMADKEVRDIDPDLTLRRMVPQADRAGEEVARVVPRAMQAAGSMAEGLAAMTPLLRNMAARMRAIAPQAD